MRPLFSAMKLSLLHLAMLPAMACPAAAQQAPPAKPFVPNYDESKIPPYTLPDALTAGDGAKVTTAEAWKARRAELYRLFEEHVYGRIPGGQPEGFHFVERQKVEGFLGGKATLREIRVLFTAKEDGPFMDLLVVAPAGKTKVPAFLGLNFQGNHAVHPATEITLSASWMRPKEGAVVENRATEAARGAASSRWPLEMIVDRGFALVTAYYGDIDPDFDDGFANGVHPLFYQAGQKKPGAAEWGSIGAWAWGLSRAMDVLEKDAAIDAGRVAVMGHSRLGKTSLWAGASDERFAIVISNNSGCGGAALSRRAIGETVWRINTAFPHWFNDKFNDYNENENALPVDQHELIALIAPRPVYVASATEDTWADPKGEFLAAQLAEPVYALFGKKGLGVAEWPAADTPVGDAIGYHLRTGKHDVTDYDWEQYLNFASRHFGLAK